MGMCQTCYLSDYHKRRTKVKRKAQQLKAKAEKEAKRVVTDDTT
jgi:F0F1-type ATP synthase membrane subunit b/b'